MAQTITFLGIDGAKLVFHVVGMDNSVQVVLRKRLAHSALLRFIAEVCSLLPPAKAKRVQPYIPTHGSHKTTPVWVC
jgi:hypothetical protein